MSKLIRTRVLLLSFCLFGFCSTVFGQGSFTNIVSTGDSANGDGWHNGLSFRTYLNDLGDVSFESFVLGSSTWNGPSLTIRKNSGQQFEIWRIGDTTEGDFLLFNGYQTGLNNKGQVLIMATGYQPELDEYRQGLYRWDFGLSPIAVQGNQTFDGSGVFGSFYWDFIFYWYIPNYGFNESGNTSFGNAFLGNNRQVETAIFLSPDSAIYQGDDAPGELGVLDHFSSQTQLNDVGNVTFRAITQNNESNRTGIFRAEQDGEIVPIMLFGDEVPDRNGFFSTYLSHYELTMNNSGQVAFRSYVDTNDGLANDGVFRGDGNSLVQIMRKGSSADGFTGIFDHAHTYARILINDPGEVAFKASFTEEGQSSIGIFRSSASGLSLSEIARQGQLLDTGDRLGSLVESFALNQEGHVAFAASLLGYSTGTNNADTVLIGDGEELITIAKAGDNINGQRVVDFYFTGGERYASGLNNRGQVAFYGKLTDGTQTVQRWTPDIHWRRSTGGEWDQSDRWTLGIEPASLYDIFIDSNQDVSVTGPSTNKAVKSLTIGGGDGEAILDLQSGTTIKASQGIVVKENGILSGGGTVRANLENLGRITADKGKLKIDGSVDNQSIVNISTGKADFSGGVDNFGYISVADQAISNFNADLLQKGWLELSPDATANVRGELSGDEGFFGGGSLHAYGEFRPGNGGAASVIFEGNLILESTVESFFELGGLESGEFDQLQVGNLNVDGDLAVSLIGGHQLNPGDSYLIASVDEQLWGQFNGLDEGGLIGTFDGIELVITYQGGDGNDIYLNAR